MVLGEDPVTLPKVTSSVPQLVWHIVWHRQDWSILRPLITLSENELADISNLSTYVARQNLWDALVDLATKQVIVAQGVRDEMAMGCMHEELVNLLVSTAEDAAAQNVIKALAVKTRDSIDQYAHCWAKHGP